jgi:glucose dehydrogenase
VIGIKEYRYFAVIVLVLGASQVFASPQGVARDSNGGDWVYADHDLAGTRYSDLKQITAKNVWWPA